MSDFIWSYKNYTSFLKEDQSDFNYDSFKHILYGSNGMPSSHNGYNGQNRGISSTRENQDDQYKGERRTDLRNQLDDSGRAYQDRESARRMDSYNRIDDRQDYSHLDELERLSSCLLRLLGKARKKHCKVRKNFELPVHSSDIHQPKRRIETTSIGDSPARNVTTARPNTDMRPVSFSDGNTQMNASNPMLVGICNTPTSMSEVRKDFELPAQSNDIHQPKRRIETSIGDSPPRNFLKVQSNTDIRPLSFSDGNTEICGNSTIPVGICTTPTSMSEVDSILNVLHDLDNTEDDLNHITPSLVQVQPMTPMASHNSFSAQTGPAPRIVSTTPRGNHANLFDRERTKKENHNMVERRRRSHINDRIKELGSLLPNCDDANFRRNKGSVLKATVEYIQQLQKDRERFGHIEERLRQNFLLHKKMLFRIQRLEALMEIQSLDRGLSDNSHEISIPLQPNTVNDVTVSRGIRANAISTKNQSAAVSSAAMETFDDVMSDSSDDSLFSSPSGSPNSLV